MLGQIWWAPFSLVARIWRKYIMLQSQKLFISVVCSTLSAPTRQHSWKRVKVSDATWRASSTSEIFAMQRSWTLLFRRRRLILWTRNGRRATRGRRCQSQSSTGARRCFSNSSFAATVDIYRGFPYQCFSTKLFPIPFSRFLYTNAFCCFIILCRFQTILLTSLNLLIPMINFLCSEQRHLAYPSMTWYDMTRHFFDK